MRNIGKWLLIAETAESLVEADNTDNCALTILSEACKALNAAGYPCVEKKSEYEIELNGKEIIVQKNLPSGQSDEALENALKENDRLMKENKILNSDINRMKNDIRAVLQLEARLEEKTEEKESVPESYDIYDIHEIELVTDSDYNSSEEDDVEDLAEIEDMSMDEELEEHTIMEFSEILEEASDNNQKIETLLDITSVEDEMEGYKMPLSRKEFALSYQTIEIRQDNSSVTTTAEIVSSPLSMKEGESDIIAWVNDNVNREVCISRDSQKSVLMHVGSIPIIVSGRVENGQFRGAVATTKEMEEAGVSIEAQETNINGNGHVLIEDEGIAVRVVPISDGNKANGDAEFLYAVLEEGKEPVVGDNISSNDALFEFRGTALAVIARWKNDMFYATVKPA